MGINSYPVALQAESDGPKCHTEKLLQQIYEHFDGQHLIDVTFKLSNPDALVPAHRLILSAASTYFKELFRSHRGICPQIEITEIDSATFERLIIFCYSGKTLLTLDNVDEMLKASLILRLETAVSNCADFIIEHISEYTLQRAYDLSTEARCSVLDDTILEYELKDFMTVIHSNEFLNFHYSKLQKLIENDRLNMESEKDVFEAVKLWYKHDPFARKQHLPELMACLRLTQFDTDFIINNIQSLPGCRSLALDAISCINSPDPSNVSLRYAKPREVQDKLLLALQLETGIDEPVCFLRYNKADDLWQKWIDIKINISKFQTVLMDENLIFIGGRREDEVINEASSWSFKTKAFKQLPSMNEARYSHGVVVLNKELYAIGGVGNCNDFLQSVEKYTPSNGWKFMKSMSTPRISPGVVALSGKIYVMGGFNDRVLKTVECFDPTTNSWTECADMNEGHDMPGFSVHNGQIFIVGGCTTACDKTVERYDPQRNAWTKICSLNDVRWKIGCISLDKKLWAVGGEHTGDAYKDYVSVYDEGSDKWDEKDALPVTGVYYCFTVPNALCT